MSWVNFSSGCNAQPPLLNKRQHNVHRCNLHMLQFRTKKQTKSKDLDPLLSVQSSIMKHRVSYIHTVNIRCETFLSAQFVNYMIIHLYLCALLWYRLQESTIVGKKRFSPFFHAKEYLKKMTMWLQKPAWWLAKKKKKKSEELNHCPQKEQIINVGSWWSTNNSTITFAIHTKWTLL